LKKGFVFSLLQEGPIMRKLHILLMVIPLWVWGCASTPIPTTLTAVTENPQEYRNELVTMSAPVLSNPAPSGDIFRTWTFTIGSPQTGRIMVTESGYNPTTINKAYNLVAEAVKDGAPITVTGELRVGPYKALREGTEIDLKSVSYKGITIATNEGPYEGGYYYYPAYGPFFYPGPYWGYWPYPYRYGWW
jgi:hypothetical protein